MSVLLRRGQALVAEKLLDRAQVRAGIKHVCGKSVAQSVRVHSQPLRQLHYMPIQDDCNPSRG